VKNCNCQSYRFVGQDEWRPIPDNIQVPHVFRPGRKEIASAFVVQRIKPVESNERPNVEWFSKGGQWKQGYGKEQRHPGVPTRGEYLIRPGGNGQMREFRAVLELKPPYLADVRTAKAPNNLLCKVC